MKRDPCLDIYNEEYVETCQKEETKHWKLTTIRPTADFSAATKGARREMINFVKVLKKNQCKLEMCIPKNYT